MKAKDKLKQIVRYEQGVNWDELARALNRTINGTWSIEAANLCSRIVRSARLVGPTPHGEVNWRLVAGGVYEAVLCAGGIPPDLPADEAEWERAEALMADHMGEGADRTRLRKDLASTVVAIKADADFIGGEFDG